MSGGFDLPWFCWVFGLAFGVFVVLVVTGVRRTDRRWLRVIDGHHARTGGFPTLADVARPVRRLLPPVAAAPVVEDDPDEPRWWLLDCPACALSAHVAGTPERIDAAVDWHNRTHHGATAADSTGARWAA